MSIEESERELRKVCEMRSFSFSVSFSDVTGSYEAEASGVGKGETVSIKDAGDMKTAMIWLAEKISTKLPNI